MSLLVNQKRNFCVFCGSGKLSKEHLWPEWMHALLPPPNADWHQSLTTESHYEGKQKIETPNTIFHRGPIREYKVRKFCKKCNSEWMSLIEINAKHIVEDLMFSKTMQLTRSEIEPFVKWIVLRTMVFEQACRYEDVVCTQSDYDRARTDQAPTSDWNIWIGSHRASKWCMRLFSHPMAACLPSATIGPTRSNIQTTSIGIGQLFIHVCLSGLPELLGVHNPPIDDSSHILGESGLLRIWPYKNNVHWPRSFFLNENDLMQFSRSLSFITRNPPDHLLN